MAHTRTTTFAYDPAGQLETTTLADGVILSYTYDAAHDLRSITDNLGNRVDYTYDARGNRTQETLKDASGLLVNRIDTAFDLRNHVASISIGDAGEQSVTQRFLDALGNLTGEIDPNQNPQTSHTYDPLNRLTESIDALSQATQYAHDLQDNLVQVVAPNGAATQYIRDDLGNLLRETGPDRGTITYTHDEAGNVVSMTDARGVTALYRYDALNRIILTDYPGTEEDQSFTYDECPGGVGRLCRIQDNTGATAYAYDGFGNITTETRDQDGETYATHYAWDAGDRLTAMTYPNGRTVTWQRDALGRITAMNSESGTNTQTILSNRTYRADGLMTSQSFSNGLTETRSYDTQGRLVTQGLGSHEQRIYSYDANGNVTAIQRPWVPSEYEYDALDRIVAENTGRAPVVGGTPIDDLTMYDYDANGNRLSRIRGTALATGPDCDPDVDENCDVICTPADWCFEPGESTRDYTYLANSNRLIKAGNKTVETDAAGNTLSDTNGKRIFEYNSAGRLFKFYKGGILKAEYIYNSRNQRTKKVLHNAPDADGKPVSHVFLYIYDLEGNLISEYRNGKPFRDYFWADGMPVQRDRIRVKNDGTIAIRNSLALVTDHLNTPRLALDGTDAIVWRWDSGAFGNGGIDKDPDGDGIKHNVRLRFPGQYADPESGLYYNHHRYYDPRTGRYLTSDPIGLEGGINTNQYGNANPTRFIDPEGLNPAAGVIGGTIVGGLIGGMIGAGAGIVLVDMLFDNDSNSDDPDQCDNDDDERCERAKNDARRIYNDLVTKRIPQYLYGTRTQSADSRHLRTIRQRQTALRDALGRVRLHCKRIPPEYP